MGACPIKSYPMLSRSFFCGSGEKKENPVTWKSKASGAEANCAYLKKISGAVAKNVNFTQPSKKQVWEQEVISKTVLNLKFTEFIFTK